MREPEKLEYWMKLESWDIDSVIRFTSIWEPHDGDSIAEDAAEYFWNHDNGWEYDWPLTFQIYDKEMKLIGTYEVSAEPCPVFSAFKRE